MNTPFLTDAEIDELDGLLQASHESRGCTDVWMLDGFMSAMMVGPDPSLSARWLLGFAGEWCDAPRICQLVTQHGHALADQFCREPDGYCALFALRAAESREVSAIEKWCAGFLRAINLSRQQWRPLFDDPNTNGLLLAVSIFGEDAGRQQMAAAPHLADQHQQIADRLTACTIAIYYYWLDRRSGEWAKYAGPPGRPPVDLAFALCPCGSGKSFNHCCGATRTLH